MIKTTLAAEKRAYEKVFLGDERSLVCSMVLVGSLRD
jgi:hypothetical protein